MDYSIEHLCKIVKEQNLLHVRDDYLRELEAGYKADLAEAATRILRARVEAGKQKKVAKQ